MDLNKKFYLSEFEIYDGENFVTFNIVNIDTDKKEIVVMITHAGRISQRSFDLLNDNGKLYFEYGSMFEKIAVEDFEQQEN